MGKNRDIFGRRYCILFGTVCALVGFIISGTTHDFNTLIGGLALVGVGAGFISVAVSAVSEMLPNRHRPYGVAFLGMS